MVHVLLLRNDILKLLLNLLLKTNVRRVSARGVVSKFVVQLSLLQHSSGKIAHSKLHSLEFLVQGNFVAYGMLATDQSVSARESGRFPNDSLACDS
jgi:hypothetical protein